MPLFDMVDQRRMVRTPFRAEAVPSSFGELNSASYDHQQLSLVSDAAENSYRRAMDEMVDPLFDDTDTDATQSLKRSAGFYNKPGDGIGKVPTTYNEVRFESARADLIARGVTPPTWGEVTARGEAMADEAEDTFMRASMYTTTNSPRLATFLGAAGGSAVDPLVVASVLLTLPLGASVGVGRAMLVEGAVSGGLEIPIQQRVMAWHEQRGKEYTLEDAATVVGLSTLLPAAFAGAMSKGYKMLGGRNANMIKGAEYDIRQLEILRKGRLRGYKRQTRREAAASEKTLSEWSQEGVAGSYVHKMESGSPPVGWATLSSTTHSFATGIPQESGMRGAGLIESGRFYLESVNPARGTAVEKLSTGAEIDALTYSMARSEMDAADKENLQHVIYALETGQPINLPKKSILSVELFTGAKDLTHIVWAKDIRAKMNEAILKGGKGGFKIAADNKQFAGYVNEIMLREFEPKLSLLAGKADLPPAPSAPKPRQSMEKIEVRQTKAADSIAEAEKHLNKLEELSKQLGKWWKKDKLAEEAGAPRPTKPDYFVEPEKIARLQKKWGAQKTKGMEELEKTAGAEKQHLDYNVSQKHIEQRKAATQAAKDLDSLRRGKVPEAYKFFRDALSDSILDFANKPKYMDDIAMSAGAERVLKLNGAHRSKWVTGAPAPKTLREGLDAVEASMADPVDAARYAEFKRLDATMTFENTAGEMISVQKAMDDYADRDVAIEAMKACAI